MATKIGRAGAVKIATTAVANIESWKLDFEDETVDITGLGATTRSHLGVGLPTISGSCKFTALDNADASTVLVKAGLTGGTTVALNLYEDGTKYWACPTTYITSFSVETSVGGVVSGAKSKGQNALFGDGHVVFGSPPKDPVTKVQYRIRQEMESLL